MRRAVSYAGFTEALDAFRRRYQTLATAARVELTQGTQDTGTPEA